MNQFKYVGKDERHVAGLGFLKPGQSVSVSDEVSVFLRDSETFEEVVEVAEPPEEVVEVAHKRKPAKSK
jgi:hypothetical protein